MTARMIGKSWWVDISHRGQRRRIKSPENTRAGALAYEAVLRHKLALGEKLVTIDQSTEQLQTFGDFAEVWLRDYVQPNNKPSERRTKGYVLKSVLIPFFGSTVVARISAHDTEKFKIEQIRLGKSNKTIKNYLTVLNKCLKTAYEWLQIDGAPPKIKWPKCNPPKMDFLTPEECTRLYGQARDVTSEMVLMGLRTGMRQGELKALQWSSIDWENRSVTVRHSRDDREKTLVSPKNNRERHIPLDTDLYEILFKRKKSDGYVFLDHDQRPFDYHRMERRLSKACNEAGLRKIGWHTLRHTFASQLAAKGVPMTAVQQLMGHSSITTTMRYSHLAPSTLRSAIDMLSPRTVANENFGQPTGNAWQNAQTAQMMDPRLLSKFPS